MHAPRCIGEGAGGGRVVEGGFVGDDYGIRTGLKQGSFATIVLYSRDFPRQWRRIDRWYNDRFGMEGGEKEGGEGGFIRAISGIFDLPSIGIDSILFC